MSVICQLYPYVKQNGSRSDLTIVKPDLGPNYLQKFTATSYQLYPYVKQHGSRSDLTIVKPDPGLNCQICISSPQLPVSYILMSNSMGPDQTNQLSSLIWVQTICKSSPQLNVSYLSVISVCQYPYVKHGSRSDLTIVKPDLGPNYLQKFTATSYQLYPYVKQHGSRSDLTIAVICQLYPYVKQYGSRSSLIWFQTICISSPQLPVSYILMSDSMGPDQTNQLSSLIWVQTICKSSPQLNVSYILMSNSMGPDQTKQLSSLI